MLFDCEMKDRIISFLLDKAELLLQSQFEPIPLFKRSHPLWYPLLPSLTSLCCSSYSTLIPWCKTIAPFSLCLIGPSLTSGKRSVRRVDALPIRKAPISKPFWFAFGRG